MTFYEVLKGYNFTSSCIEETGCKELFAYLLHTANEESCSILKFCSDDTDPYKILGRNQKFVEEIGGLKELLSIHLNQDQPSNEQPGNTVENFLNYQRNTEVGEYIIQCKYIVRDKNSMTFNS